MSQGIMIVTGAVDLSNWSPPKRNRIDRNGEPAEERLPSGRAVAMLSPAGDWVHVVPFCGMAHRDLSSMDAKVKLRDRIQRGFIPLDACPSSRQSLFYFDVLEHVPADLRRADACEAAPDGAKITGSNPCACMVELGKRRRAKHLAAMEREEERFARQEQAALARQVPMVREVVDALLAADAKNRKGR